MALRVAASLHRLGYRAGSQVLAAYRFIFRPTVRGVRCALMRGGEVLLVRHTYGDRRWSLPGGLMRRGEAGEVTARREMREELGIDIAAWRALGRLTFDGPDRARHLIECLSAPLPDSPLEVNSAEIAEVRWVGRGGVPRDSLEQTAEIVEMAWRAARPAA